MDYIDDLYRKMMASQGRYPANDAFDQVLKSGKPAPPGTNLVGGTITDPNAVLNPLGAQMPAKIIGSEIEPMKSAPIVIDGERVSPTSGPIMPTEDDASKRIPYIENYRQNINPALRTQIQDAESLIDEKNKRELDRNLSRSALLSVARVAAESPEPFISQYDYDERIKNLSKMSDIGDVGVEIPKRDFLSEMILNLGPALGAKFMGEAGALSAPTAMKGARDIYETQRKEQVDAIKQGAINKARLSDEISKRMIGLRQLKEGEYDVYSKDREFRQDQLNKLADRLEKMDDRNFEGLKDIETKLQALGIDTTKGVMTGAKEMADMEADREKLLLQEKGLQKRAGLTRTNYPSEGERKAASALATVQRANRTLEGIGGPNQDKFPSLKDPMFGLKSSLLSGRIPLGEAIESQVKDPAIRAQIQAEADWIAAKLRRESGAAISVGEYKAESNRYFPRKGDSKSIIEEKAAARKQVELGLRQESGRATPPPIAPTPKYKEEVKEAPKAPQKKPSNLNLKEMTYEQKLKEAKRRGLIK